MNKILQFVVFFGVLNASAAYNVELTDVNGRITNFEFEYSSDLNKYVNENSIVGVKGKFDKVVPYTFLKGTKVKTVELDLTSDENVVVEAGSLQTTLFLENLIIKGNNVSFKSGFLQNTSLRIVDFSKINMITGIDVSCFYSAKPLIIKMPEQIGDNVDDNSFRLVDAVKGKVISDVFIQVAEGSQAHKKLCKAYSSYLFFKDVDIEKLQPFVPLMLAEIKSRGEIILEYIRSQPILFKFSFDKFSLYQEFVNPNT